MQNSPALRTERLGRFRLLALIALIVLAVAGSTLVLTGGNDEDIPVPIDEPVGGDERGSSPMRPDGDDGRPVELEGANLKAGCRLPHKWIEYVYEGWDPGEPRDSDLAIVPHPPNYMGSITDTSHSGPYGFLQKVPLVFYGPGHLARSGSIDPKGPASLIDLAPTYAAAMDFAWPRRTGIPLTEILNKDAAPPKLIVTAVIDGGGWNVLEYWPDAWPEIGKLMKAGASIEDAVVGSSPSITPAIHTNLSTGLTPRRHGVEAIIVRSDGGQLSETFAPVGANTGVRNMDATLSLRTTTLGDDWDLATDNRALVGMVSPGFLQIGMVGAGASHPGGDKDIVAVLAKKSGDWGTNPDLYSLPDYVNEDVRGPKKDKEEVDRSDGVVDGLWRGNEIAPTFATPAMAPWENRTIKALIEREGFGEDEVTDLFYINYKAPDAAGHLYNMIAPEQEDTIESVDTAIGDLRRWLDRAVGPEEYILVVTADHGQTPLGAGGWPIRPLEIIDDLNEAFDATPNGRGVIQDTSAHTLFLNAAELETNGVGPEDVADFLFRYTFAENVDESDAYPAEFVGRENERIFETVIPGGLVDDVYGCSSARAGRKGDP